MRLRTSQASKDLKEEQSGQKKKKKGKPSSAKALRSPYHVSGSAEARMPE